VHQEVLDAHMLISPVKHSQLRDDFISFFENQSSTSCLQSLSTSSLTIFIAENSYIKLLENEIVKLTQIIEELHLQNKLLYSMTIKFEQARGHLREKVNVELSRDGLYHL
ncbi:unnamed protein product, partial [Rotaria sp. Silwood1]